MSEQTKNSDTANWAIIKQLMNDDSTSSLGNGQLADIAAPQPVDADIFASTAAAPQPQRAPAPQAANTHAFVSAKPATRQAGGSLMESISASLKPAAVAEPAPEPVHAEPAVNPFAQAELAAAASVPPSAPQPAFVAPQPLRARQLQSRALSSFSAHRLRLRRPRCRKRHYCNPCWRKSPHAVSLCLFSQGRRGQNHARG